jgi:geranylgeranyl reductase family protein
VEQVDVAIVGAGPAGSRCAWRLACAGARVALLDGSHPREKPCGGGITGRALDIVRASTDLASFRAVRIERASFEHDSQRVDMAVDAAGDASELIVAARRDFDGALLASAAAAGAALIPERVTGVEREDGAWEVATRGQTIRARWLVGADGPKSLVRRRLSAPFDRADLSIALGFFVRGVTSTRITVAFEDRPAGYLWSFPRRDHLAVGICAQADASTPAALAPLASNWIARHVPDAVEMDRYGWAIPSLRERTLDRDRPAGPGWMLLGDAAGLVDPITREGIFFALQSADAAANSLLAGGTDAAATYTQWLRETIYPELMRAARLKAMFFRPAFTRLLLRALAKSAAIRQIMIDLIAGRQSYRELRRRLLTTGEFRLMLALMKPKPRFAIRDSRFDDQ